jgi:hypothetical protein
MFGRFVGELLALPVRIAGVPVKLVQVALSDADSAIYGEDGYQAPTTNGLDHLADGIEDAANSLFGE